MARAGPHQAVLRPGLVSKFVKGVLGASNGKHERRRHAPARIRRRPPISQCLRFSELSRRHPCRGAIACGSSPIEARGGSQAEPFVSFHEKIGRHTSELQSLMRTSYADFCLTKKNNK